MYHSTFIVNRQMITDSSQIVESLNKYLSSSGKKFTNFFYRLEWYRIGISIPMVVYSEEEPVLQLRPECQLTGSNPLPWLEENAKTFDFKIFLIPFKNAGKNEDLDHKFIESWLQKKLKGAAKIIKSELGPNNRIYYKTSPDSDEMKQIQSYSLRGQLEYVDLKKLESIRKKPLGYYPNLGCGLLLL